MPSRPSITFQSNLYNKVATTKTPNQASVSLKRRGETLGKLFGDPISIHKSLNGVTVDGVDKNEVTWHTWINKYNWMGESRSFPIHKFSPFDLDSKLHLKK